VWRGAGPGRTVEQVRVEQPEPHVARVVVQMQLPANQTKYTNTYTVLGNGDVVVQADIEPAGQLPALPRFGMQMEIPAEFKQMTWYGRGPHENYWDRKTGAAVGIYHGDVAELTHPYVRPQENANRCDVRWVAWTNTAGGGLMASGMPLLSVSAWPYRMADLETAAHNYQLPRRDTITVNLDLKQMGVGGDNSWGARTHPEYMLPAQPRSYRFRLSPVTAAPGR